MDVFFVHSCRVWSLTLHIRSYCCSFQSQISQNVCCCFCGSGKNNHQELDRKEIFKNVAARSFIIKQRFYHQQQSACHCGENLLQFCISLQGSFWIFSFLLFKAGFGNSATLVKFFKVDEATSQDHQFCSGDVKYLVLCKSSLQQTDSATASLQRRRVRMEKQRHLGGNVLLALGRQHLFSGSHSYLWAGLTRVLPSLEFTGLALRQSTLWMIFLAFSWEREVHHLVRFYLYFLNIYFFLLTSSRPTPVSLGPRHCYCIFTSSSPYDISVTFSPFITFPPTMTSEE